MCSHSAGLTEFRSLLLTTWSGWMTLDDSCLKGLTFSLTKSPSSSDLEGVAWLTLSCVNSLTYYTVLSIRTVDRWLFLHCPGYSSLLTVNGLIYPLLCKVTHSPTSDTCLGGGQSPRAPQSLVTYTNP